MHDASPVCPLCGPSEFRKLFLKKERQFYRCEQCEIELQWPLPTPAELAAFYDESFDDGMYQDFAAARDLKRMTAERRIKEIRPYVPLEGRWLDVGCANGVFVEAVGEFVEAEGVEISQNAVMDGRERGLNLSIGAIEDYPKNRSFDCITAFDVLEHVTDPNHFIESIRKRINDEGTLVITVPNCGGIVRKIMGKNWYFYIPEEHLHYFNEHNLSALLIEHGFEVVNVSATRKPMTYRYALLQFEEFNPLIYRILNLASRLIPSWLKTKPIPLPIGELKIIARKIPAPAVTDDASQGSKNETVKNGQATSN